MFAAAHLGVDFGTSHTVAVLRREDGSTAPLLFDSSPLLSSAIFAEPGGELYSGRDAVYSARLEPACFEPNPKRRVDDGTLLLGGTELSVSQAFAAVLSRVRVECERVFGSLPATTLTYPATWGSARRLVLEDAAREAGYGSPRLLHEPVAAATYFARIGPGDIPEGMAVVVCDFGGGTFDVSVVARTAEGFVVREVDGSAELGGVDLDHLLIGHVGSLFPDSPQWTALAAPQSPEDRRHYRSFSEDVRAAKERLSRRSHVEIPVPLLNQDVHLSREELERLARPLLDRAVRITVAVYRAASLTPQRTAGVFLVGGASQMPLVATLLHQALGIAPTVIAEPELVVAHGATLPAEGPRPLPVAVSPSAPVEVPAPVPPVAFSPPPSPPVPYAAMAPTVLYKPPANPKPPVVVGAVTNGPRRPRWLTVAQVVMWMQVAALVAYAVAMIIGTVVESGLVDESDAIELCGDFEEGYDCTYDNDADLDGDDESDVYAYIEEDLVSRGVYPALAWPVCLLAAAGVALGAIQAGRRRPHSRGLVLLAQYGLIAGAVLIAVAAAVADVDESEAFVSVLAPAGVGLTAAVALILFHRGGARDWFGRAG